MTDILIVEDKESLRTMLRKTLETRGFAVEEAADVSQARQRLRKQRFLVVLTDLKLPAGSGFDVLGAAREADPDTPVIVMTAYGTVEEAVRAMKEGAADFLTKPVDTDHLLLLLDRAVERRRQHTELVLLREEYQSRFGFPRVLGEDPAHTEVKYLHGNYGMGTFTFLGGHDPEDYQHAVGDQPTDLSLHVNSPGYRLILNNILFPAAKKKKMKT